MPQRLTSNHSPPVFLDALMKVIHGDFARALILDLAQGQQFRLAAKAR